MKLSKNKIRKLKRYGGKKKPKIKKDKYQSATDILDKTTVKDFMEANSKP